MATSETALLRLPLRALRGKRLPSLRGLLPLRSDTALKPARPAAVRFRAPEPARPSGLLHAACPLELPLHLDAG